MSKNKVELDKTAYLYLKNKIISGELHPGQSIVETEISNELNMSRTPVRAALKMLEKDSLVKVFPAKGAFVADLTVQDIEELFEFRILLEKEGLRCFINNAPDDVIDHYLSLFNRYTDMGQFLEDYHDVDSNFHMTIMKYIQNTRIISTYVQLYELINWSRHIAANDKNRARSTPKEHIDILEYAKKRDIENATAALVKHLKSVEQSVIYSYKNIFYQL